MELTKWQRDLIDQLASNRTLIQSRRLGKVAIHEFMEALMIKETNHTVGDGQTADSGDGTKPEPADPRMTSPENYFTSILGKDAAEFRRMVDDETGRAPIPIAPWPTPDATVPFNRASYERAMERAYDHRTAMAKRGGITEERILSIAHDIRKCGDTADSLFRARNTEAARALNERTPVIFSVDPAAKNGDRSAIVAYERYADGALRQVSVEEANLNRLNSCGNAMLKDIADSRSCTCHPDDAPVPCQRKYALSECLRALTPIGASPLGIPVPLRVLAAGDEAACRAGISNLTGAFLSDIYRAMQAADPHVQQVTHGMWSDASVKQLVADLDESREHVRRLQEQVANQAKMIEPNLEREHQMASEIMDLKSALAVVLKNRDQMNDAWVREADETVRLRVQLAAKDARIAELTSELALRPAAFVDPAPEPEKPNPFREHKSDPRRMGP
jgi:hypothetical protein